MERHHEYVTGSLRDWFNTILSGLLSVLISGTIFWLQNPNLFNNAPINWRETLLTFAVGVIFTIFVQRLESIEQSIRTRTSQIDRTLLEYQNSFKAGIVNVGEEVYRILRYNKATGVLYNDWNAFAPRNVLLNIRTIKLVLLSVAESGAEPLHALGMRCGREFGNQLPELIREYTGARPRLLRAIIDLWFDYDSNAGFGAFSVDFGQLRRGDDFVILLKESFIHDDLALSETALAPFMTGYIQGVIDSIPRQIVIDAGYASGKLQVVPMDEGDAPEAIGRRWTDGDRWTVSAV